MSAEPKNNDSVLLPPRYIMLDKSDPPYDRILRRLQESKTPMIGSSYYYIRAGYGWQCLCRLCPTRGPVMFNEILDAGDSGVSDEDLRAAIEEDKHFFGVAGFYGISAVIEGKLRVGWK